MKCLIIASGRGSGLSNKGDSKPLIQVLGLSLIERLILSAKNAGLTDFYVVTGYNGEKVRDHLNRFSQSRNIDITHIINEERGKGVGLSVLKAKNYMREPFILLMADHLFDYKILFALQKQTIEDDECILCVDKNHHKYLDVDDATKVFIEDG